MMRKTGLWNIFVMIVGGGAILLLWVFLPSFLLRRFREDAFRTEVTVSSEDVNPYGVQYANLKKRMKRSIDAMDHASEYVEKAVSKKDLTDPEFLMVKSGIPAFVDFMASFGMVEESDLLFLKEGDFVIHLYGTDSAECVLALLGSENWYALYDPWDGIPVSGNVNCQGEDWDVQEQLEAWDKLLNAYEKTMGIPFRTAGLETSDVLVDYASGDSMTSDVLVDYVSDVPMASTGDGEDATASKSETPGKKEIAVKYDDDGKVERVVEVGEESALGVEFVGKSADGAFVVRAKYEKNIAGEASFRFWMSQGE